MSVFVLSVCPIFFCSEMEVYRGIPVFFLIFALVYVEPLRFKLIIPVLQFFVYQSLMLIYIITNKNINKTLLGIKHTIYAHSPQKYIISPIK